MKRVNLLEKNKRAGKLLKQARSSPPLPKESSLVSPLQRTNHNFFTHGYERHGASPRRQLLRVVTRAKKACSMGNCRERDSLASRNQNDPSTEWEREKEREEGKERGKVIKKIMDGSLLELQRTNSHFQFAPGAGASKGGVKANSSSNPRIRILARSWIGPTIFSPKNSISRPTSVPPQLRDFPSRKTYLTSAEYIYPISSWSNEFLESRKRKGREGGGLYRSKYRPTTIRTQRWFVEEEGEHGELIPSFA